MQQTNKSNEVNKSKDQSFLNQSMLNSKRQENENNSSKQNISSYSRSNSTRFVQNLNSKSVQDQTIKSQYNQQNNDHLKVSKAIQSTNTTNYLYQFWKGQHSFVLSGLIQLGPRIHYIWNLLFWFFITLMGVIHLTFVIPYVMNNVSIILGLFYIIIFSLMILFTIFTQFSDPGYIPRRKMIQTIPKLHDRIDNIEDMINEKAYRMIVDLENDQSQFQKQGNNDQSHLKISGINTSKVDVSYGNQLQSAKTHINSDLIIFKKAGSINPHIYKHGNFNFSVNNSMNTSKKIDLKESVKLDQQLYKKTSLNEQKLYTTSNNADNYNLQSENKENNQVQLSQFSQNTHKNIEANLRRQQIQQMKEKQESSFQFAQIKMQNPFVPVEEESSMSRRSNSKRDEWSENTQRNTTEFNTQNQAQADEDHLKEEEKSNQNQQKNSSNNNNNKINSSQQNDQREKFHMHIQIQNEAEKEDEEENKEQEGGEIKKRRTIYSFLERKASRQKITQQTQMNTCSKIDTLPNEANLESFNEYRVLGNAQGQNLQQSAVIENQGQEKQKYSNSAPKEKQDGSTVSVSSKQLNQDNNALKQSIASLSNLEVIDNKNFLKVRSTGLLQENMISPKIDINDFACYNNQHENKSQDKVENLNQNEKELKGKQFQIEMKEKKIEESNINKQENTNGVSQIEQIDGDDDQEQNKQRIQFKKNNNYVNEINQIAFTNNQINDQISNITQINNLFADQYSQAQQQQYFKENFQPNKIQILQQNSDKTIQQIQDSAQFYQNQTDQKNKIPITNSENNLQQSDQQIVNCKNIKPNIFFQAQKCININTLNMNSNSTNSQYEINQQNKIYESIIESNNRDLEDENKAQHTEEQKTTNIFLKYQPQNFSKFNSNNNPTCQEKVNQVTETFNNSSQNEQDQDAHKQFMMLSLQSNNITPKNNTNLKVSMNLNTQNNISNNCNNINIFFGNKSSKLNNQATKLNEKFSYEMAKYEQNIKRLSDSLMQQNPLNGSIVRNKNETIQNKNFFDLQNQSYQMAAQDNQKYNFNGRKYCVTCKIFRPLRSSHCTYCDCCVEVFDHHCKFVNNCIGKYNYKYFFSFLSLLKFTFLFQLISEILYLVDKKDSSSNPLTTAQLVLGIVYILIIFLSWLYVLYLWGFHIFIQCKRLTTREQLRDLDCDKDPKNYFNWCTSKSPIFQPRIIVSDNQRYNLLLNEF